MEASSKVFSLGCLATHVAEIPHWMTVTLTSTELDFAKGEYKSFTPATKEELMDVFESSYREALKNLENASDATMMENWTLKSGDHIIHHRGQLSVYLRLLEVPIPGMNGPSADVR